MKYFRILLLLTLTVTLCSSFKFKDILRFKNKKEKQVYVFGVAASFKDSVVYFTEIQLMDSVMLDNNGFLPERDFYSYQLKNFVERNKGKIDYTCMTYFSDNKSRLQKEFSKVKGKYAKDSSIKQENILLSEFGFKRRGE